MKFKSFLRFFGVRSGSGAGKRGRRDRGPRPSWRERSSRLTVESLEDRTLMSVLPAPVIDPSGHIDIAGAQFNAQVFSGGNHNTPSVAVDPAHPTKVVAVWTRDDPSLSGNTKVIVEGAVSTDSGVTWNEFFLPFNLTDPASANNNPQPFAQATNASVAFDRNDNFYVTYSEHAASNDSGAIVLQKYSFTSASPTQLITNKVLYEWVQDAALNPVLAVDSNLPTFTDPDTQAVQTDAFSGNVYVAWSTNNVAPTNFNNFNPNVVKVIASSDGGATFTTQTFANDGFSFASFNNGSKRLATPQMVVISATGQPVEPAYLTLFDRDVIVVTFPQPEPKLPKKE